MDDLIKHFFSDGLYAKETRIPQDYRLIQHSHSYDHMSILASGWVTVLVDGVATDYHAPACINIEAGKNHEVIGVTDSVWYCIHATDETDPEKIDEVLIRS
jgi:quercetin dioxygenase-like cupin family protein